jgi:hypothetical protein
MFCNNCGKQIDDNAVVCIHCGVPTKTGPTMGGSALDGKLGCLMGGLCFLFPIVGLILYLVWNSTMPMKAKEAGKWALIGFGVSIAFSILYYVAFAGMIASGMSTGYY